jgi:predicted AlkP superfamily pyrophosphatase or phosphodiesterase
MRRTLVLDVVGLTPGLLGAHTPVLAAFAASGRWRPLVPTLPAVTCTMQSTFVTGSLPRDHGCVANGWYYRDIAEVSLWRQAGSLVGGAKLWDLAKQRDPSFTCAHLFWWYAMYASADFIVTPRPMYPADGRKLPDVWTHPPELRATLQAAHGQFPLFDFWGPRAGLPSSAWITAAAIDVWRHQQPTLSLVYLPHLDYVLQREGPAGPGVAAALREVDALCGELIAAADQADTGVVILSEYGITPVTGAVHPNRVLRDAGLVTVRRERGHELLDAGACEAFAVADHQLAHVYVKRPERIAEVKRLLEQMPGVDRVLDEAGKHAAGLDHVRAGELVAIAKPDTWFSYYYWLDDACAPDFARTVEIHRKPGYDPVELFLDPTLRLPRATVGWKLARRKLGFRTLLDVIPLDTSLVRGSHGRMPDRVEDGPLVMSNTPALFDGEGPVAATAIRDLVLAHVFTSPG